MLNSLISLGIKTWINGRLRVSELLTPTLQWSMLGLLPCRHVWRWWDVYTGHGVCVRRHVRLNALACQGWRNVCRLLLVWTHDGGGVRLCMLRGI
jgi:hypothetical protein